MDKDIGEAAQADHPFVFFFSRKPVISLELWDKLKKKKKKNFEYQQDFCQKLTFSKKIYLYLLYLIPTCKF